MDTAKTIQPQSGPKSLKAELGDLTLRASLFKPIGSNRDITLFCLPGGGLTQAYFDLTPDYSFTARMTALGYTVLSMDHPGIASNALPEDYPFFSPREAATHLTNALNHWIETKAVPQKTLGIGHSMGGMMTMLMQGLQAPFNALALLGSNAGGLDWGLTEAEKHYIDKPEAFAKDLEALALTKFKAAFSRPSSGPSGNSILFGGENPDVTQKLRDIACGMHSASAMMSMTRGSFKKEAEAISVPLFFAFGDHDLGIPPKDVPKDFPNASDISVTILKATGHNHFAFGSIRTLCTKLDQWIIELQT